MPYELFKRTGIRVDTPAISVGPQKITLNAAASRILEDANGSSVLLLWDKATRRMAVKISHDIDKNTFAASRTYSSTNIRCKEFLRYIGWASPKRVVMDATWNDKERMFEATLPLEHLAPYRFDPVPEEELTAAEESEIEQYLRSTSSGSCALTVDELYKAFALGHTVRAPGKTLGSIQKFFTRNAHAFKKVRRPNGELAFLWKRGS